MTDPVVDLRSDTLTKPSEAMRAAMAAAEVGDDVYSEDPTVGVLEERVAALFGHEAALFTPTGSMANMLAIRAIVPVGAEVLCEAQAHIARAELGAHAAFGGVTMRTWTGHPRRPNAAEQIEPMIAPDLGPFLVATAALSVENTHNFAGGVVSTLADLQAVRSLADRHGLKVHLDGARLWNAHVSTGTALDDYGATADVLCVCLSKGLGAPVGSLIVGSSGLIADARVWRKRLGGGMRQVGVLAAAGLYALDHHLERLAEDHTNARALARMWGVNVDHVDSNIVVVPCADAAAIVTRAALHGVLVSAVGLRSLRAVTHLGVSSREIEHAGQVVAGLLADRAS